MHRLNSVFSSEEQEIKSCRWDEVNVSQDYEMLWHC